MENEWTKAITAIVAARPDAWLCEKCNLAFRLQDTATWLKHCKKCGQPLIPTSPNARRIVELTVELEKLKKLPDMLIGFIPEGWGMPLGWGQLVAQVKQALKELEGCHGL